MPSDYWDDIADEHDFDWENVDSVEIIRGDSDWHMVIDTGDELIEVEESWDDDEWREHFWDDLYDYLSDEGIDLDRETDYAPE